MIESLVMKKSILLAFVALVFVGAFADVEYSDNVVWSYSLVRDEAILYGMSSPAPVDSENDILHIPETLGGKPVTEIESVSVDWHTELVIPASVTAIRHGAIRGGRHYKVFTNRLERIASRAGWVRTASGMMTACSSSTSGRAARR